MKHLAFAVTGIVMTVLVVMILMSIHSADLRRTELERSLKNSVKQTLTNACITDKVEINDNDAMVADFISSFLGKMKTNGTVVTEDGVVVASDKKDPGQKLEISIAAADIYKGILSVHVKEHFTYPNGKKGTVEASSTQIVERESSRPSLYARYYIPAEVAGAAGFDYTDGEDFLYYQRRFAEGYDAEVDIDGPEPSGYDFGGWTVKNRLSNGSVEYIGSYTKEGEA